MRCERTGRAIILHCFMILVCAIVVLPFFWMLLTALKDESEVFLIPPRIFPTRVRWANFSESWNALPFGKAYLNSLKVTVLVVLITLLTSSMSAYAFARIKFKGREIVFMLILATMMVPAQVTMVPTFILMKYLGWIDKHISLIVPASLCAPFAVFMLRQYVMGLPNDLYEAAILDGANHVVMYKEITLPLIKPALSAIAIFTFKNSWNSFLHPSIYLNSMDKYTVPLLLNLFKGTYNIAWSYMMAAVCISVLPVLAVYIIGQKYIIEGITFTGMKA